MSEPFHARAVALIRGNMRQPCELGPETELTAVLCDVERICDLPFWLEEASDVIPTDAELLSWVTVSDVSRWLALTAQRIA